jgi:uncharacterized protein (TIGR02611 family)
MNQNELARIAEEYYRLAKRVVRIVVGFTLLVVGVALIVLPGPAFIVIPLSLAILAGEFVWARRLLKRVKRQVAQYTGYGKEENSGAYESPDAGDKQSDARASEK